jgi:DNA-binding PadR family transcriptional regulator
MIRNGLVRPPDKDRTIRFNHGELHLVLLALLSQQPMHGYELMGELQRRTSGRYRPSPGSIYPAVQSLQAEGLIEATTEGDRRVYRITPVGTEALAQRMDQLVRIELLHKVKFGVDSIDAALARFAERVRKVAGRVDGTDIEDLLERTATTVEKMADEGGRTS